LSSVQSKPLDENVVHSDTASEKAPEVKSDAVVVDNIDDNVIETIDEDDDSDWESVGSDAEVTDEEPILPTECLFCEHRVTQLKTMSAICHKSTRFSYQTWNT